MFELLLLIYLLPVIFVAALILKLVLWLVKKIFQLAGWLIKHLCLEVLVAHIGRDCRSTVHQPSSGFKIIDGKKSRTRRRGGVRLYAVYAQRYVFPHVSNLFGNPAGEELLL